MSALLTEQDIQRATSMMLSDWLKHHDRCETRSDRPCSCGLADTLAVGLGDEPYTMQAVRGPIVDIPIRRPLTLKATNPIALPHLFEHVVVRDLEIGRPRVVRVEGRLIVLSRQS